jgi:hypothetical protein
VVGICNYNCCMFIDRLCGIRDNGCMAKKTGLEKIKLYKPKLMGELAITYIKSFFVPRVRRGLNHAGNIFKSYTPKYVEMKKGGFVKKDGSRLKAFKGIAITSNKTSRPDLTVRGTTLKSMQVFSFNKQGFVVGFDGQPASVIAGQRDQGRDIIKGIPKKEEAWLMRKIADMPDPEIRRLKNLRIKVNIL